MDRDRLLAAASAAQLATGLVGVAVALKRRHVYDLPLLHGRPDKINRDALFLGTALSPPPVMLVVQGWWIARLLRGTSGSEDRVLGGLGAIMVMGYLGETLVRRRLRPSSWDAVESPLVATGIGLAAAMAVLGLARRRVRS